MGNNFLLQDIPRSSSLLELSFPCSFCMFLPKPGRKPWTLLRSCPPKGAAAPSPTLIPTWINLMGIFKQLRGRRCTEDWPQPQTRLPSEHWKVGTQKPKGKFREDIHTQKSLKPNSIAYKSRGRWNWREFLLGVRYWHLDNKGRWKGIDLVDGCDRKWVKSSVL